jgi:Histidine phosphatase superfamily (branch 1)
VPLAVVLLIAPDLAAENSEQAWAALMAGGHVAVIRHGNAPPGHGGDPPGMRIDDCKTQRNLDDMGREQGRALGEAFRTHGVRVGRIVSSPMCRRMETGRLMAVGPVEISWAMLPDQGLGRLRLSELKETVPRGVRRSCSGRRQEIPRVERLWEGSRHLDSDG